MPRFANLLSALLVALIGVLVVQMFLFAALYAERAVLPAPPPASYDAIAAPAEPLFAAAPVLPPAAPNPIPIVIVVTQPAPPAPTPVPSPNAMRDFPRDTGPQSRLDAGGKALIERFITLTGTPLRDPARKES
jgi:hypothetical protein